MDPLTAGAISGGASLLGSYFQNQANSAQAQRQMDFQAHMRRTAHQDQVADLRAAGLNPILSALGNGAASPSGAMANQENLGEGISKGMDTAIAIRQQNKELDQKDTQIQNTEADTFNKRESGALIRNQASSTAKDVEAKAMQNRILNKTLEAQIKKANAEGDYSEINQIMGIINSGASSAGSLVNPLNFLKGKK